MSDTRKADFKQETIQAPTDPPPSLPAEMVSSDVGADTKEGAAEADHSASPKSRTQRFKAWVWPMAFSDAVMICLTFFIALGTIVSAAAIYMQWREMVSGGADTTAIKEAAQKQAITADKIKDSAEKSAQASRDFATSAEQIDTKIGLAEGDFASMARNSEKTIEATQDTMRLEQRAWVAVASVSGSPQIDKPFVVRVTMGNNGKTFAKELRGITNIQTVASGALPDFATEHGSQFGQSTVLLPPNAAYSTSIVLSGDDSRPHRPNPTKEILDSIKSGNQVVYVHGRVTYNDIFNRPHWTTFCYTLDITLAAWSACADHNDADGDEARNQIRTLPPKSRR